MRVFRGSLCYEGIRGGALTIEDDKVRFRSKVLTLPDEYKDLEIPMDEIDGVEKGTSFLFPTVTIRMKTGESYKFVVFSRKQFLACLKK